ncbi:L-threonylcarbamoyladenylate synthase [Aestuariimicrobium sp. p3-SID1156]|uniref:L-threonylcarbamoyladenylate synthase n=1 Tax=Aestuariimicrobium sp. p3-SID1156 TaxID=2916038 RepID=UPI0037BF5BBA
MSEEPVNEQVEPAEEFQPVEEIEPEEIAPVEEAAVEPARPSAEYYDVSSQREEALKAAARAIRSGECIVLPTDTVYGIGANALDAAAVQGLLDAKRRGRDMPPPVLIADGASLGALVQFIDEDAQALADAFWPGPLTLILRAQEGLTMDLGETRGTIAVRVPDHEFTRALLRRTGPLAVSSANLSGQPASTTIADAREQLGDTVAVYLDAGDTPGTVPSTIVDFTTSTLGTIVRQGALGVEQLKEVAGFISEPEVRELEPAPQEPGNDGDPAEALGPDDAHDAAYTPNSHDQVAAEETPREDPTP